MIEHTQLLSVKKLKGGGIIKAAARHNLREIKAEQGANSHIDPTRTHLNIILRGADIAADVASLAVLLLKQANIKPLRSDAVQGLEVLISLRPDSGIDEKAFFEAAVCWAEAFYEIPILSAVIHHDEAAPHCQIIMLPLFDGRMIGSALYGGKARLSAMHSDFFEKVGQPYGLTRPTPQKRFSSVARTTAAAMVVDYLVKHPKSINEPTIRDALRDALTDNPMPIMAALGLDMPESKKPKPKTFASYLTKRCKPEKPIGFNQSAKLISIVFALKKEAEKEQSLSCVGFGNNPQVLEPPKRQIDDDLPTDYSRVRDDDLDAKVWSEELGELIKRPTNIKPKDKEIERVRGAIQAMRR
jgi:hypothetical protein